MVGLEGGSQALALPGEGMRCSRIDEALTPRWPLFLLKAEEGWEGEERESLLWILMGL